MYIDGINYLNYKEMSGNYTMNKDEIFNPDEFSCKVEIGEIVMENPPKELIEMLVGKTLTECEKIINEYLHPKEKIVIKWNKKIGYDTSNDNR